jgi:lipopolysaccharide/colanic/teichoic acid biosynthesis glycosyltransferase
MSYARHGKRSLDLCLGTPLLLAALPVMAAVALAVLLVLGRPVLHRDPRAGRGGAPFTMIKFRSMRPGPGDDAARLTRFGRTLRALGLDELPQLFHVLSGRMSLVGPRPLPAAYTDRLAPGARARLAVPPGLTGPVQVGGRNRLPWPDRFARDAAYAANPTFLGDLAVLARTPRALLRAGASTPGHATSPAPFEAG